MKKISATGPLLAFLLAATGLFVWTNSARAGAPHIIINEIRISGASDNDEFIELFNPADKPVDLEKYKLAKKTKGGSESALVSTAKFSGIIKARGYFLIAHPDYKNEISADLSYSGSTYYISKDNTVLLYDQSGALLDKVGFGAASDFENASASNPDSNQSIERTGFADTDDNAADFSMNTSPSPQNSSIIENIGEEPQDNDGAEQSESENNDTSGQDSSKICAVSSEDIGLNELFPYPETGAHEFVELKNFGAHCIDLSGWKIMDEKENKYVIAPGTIIGPGEFWHADGNFYLNNTTAETICLLDSSGKEVDRTSYEKAVKKYSFSSDGREFFWTSIPTPGAENIFDSAKEDSSSSTGSKTENAATDENVYLNEILPNPKDGSDEEYIEIASGESEPVDLYGWRLKDASKSKGYQFKEHIILKPGEYFAIYRSETKIALNNSDESVNLYNPQGEVVSSTTFDKSQKNASFNFDGKNWKWSKYLTPGKKNKFDSEPSVKIKKPKNVFKDTFAEFSAKAKDKETKKLKYAWDFGDGKKSYLEKASHKYLDTGKYTVTLSVSDDSQTVDKSFVLAVKNYLRPDLEIVKIVPNPAGNDSDGEIVDIKNNSGKKVDLLGWKIATGAGEKSYNHPISGKISFEPNETKTITREMCKFSLNNKAGKVELVMPDGKVTDVVEYQKEKIAEDEVYAKIDGKWQWISPPASLREALRAGPPEKEAAENLGEPEETEGIVEGALDAKIFDNNSFDYGLLQENNILVFTKYSLPVDDIQSTQAGCSAKNIPPIFFPFVTWNSEISNTSPLAFAF